MLRIFFQFLVLPPHLRDVDEMTDAGFKAVARRMCVGHSHSWPIRCDLL